MVWPQDRLSGENKQETWGIVGHDMYDEGTAQVSYATPGFDSGAGDDEPGALHATVGAAEVRVPRPSVGGHGGAIRDSGRTEEGGMHQAGANAGMAEGGDHAGDGAVMQQHAGGAGDMIAEGSGRRGDGGAVRVQQGPGGMAVGSGPGSGVC
ncbi:hypothetical protein Vretimale_3489 [Volvox reticuliferus]|uniref:Uncharacterized protein n=1 Tax=Volvox reticuliferus TaxID=1737510 RepID=A0A8J4BZE6_9CHLO|nr:hypothetical protein Vretifemale_1043 [Volvox reticuliferus]GIL97918.1 hypothetical protein Vretimale_3489 [Volvox reticuliferus]